MKLQEVRKSKGLTQKELAALSSVNIRTIQQYENGARNIEGATLETLCNISLALGVKVYDILESEQLKIKLSKSV